MASTVNYAGGSYINGELIEGDSTRRYQVINPRRRTVIASAIDADVDDVAPSINNSCHFSEMIRDDR